MRYHWDLMKQGLGISDEDFVWHGLRHTSATRLLANGKDLRIIQKFMGHSRIETTLRYAHVADDLIADCVM